MTGKKAQGAADAASSNQELEAKIEELQKTNEQLLADVESQAAIANEFEEKAKGLESELENALKDIEQNSGDVKAAEDLSRDDITSELQFLKERTEELKKALKSKPLPKVKEVTLAEANSGARAERLRNYKPKPPVNTGAAPVRLGGA